MGAHDEVVAFLSGTDVVGPGVARIYRTHIALVFVAGNRALKIKRPVKLAFVDFSTLALRHAACLREIEVNRDNAPEIYLGVVPITREADGKLAIGGAGTPVEWAIEMHAFDDRDLMSIRAAEGPLDPNLMYRTADAVHAMHARSVPVEGVNLPAKMLAIIDEVGGLCRAYPDSLFPGDLEDWVSATRAAVAAVEPLLRRRAEAGAVRRCHGDLHLANIVVWKGVATLFDALEFSEEMATVDTLYDLAFLLMDLIHYDQQAAANSVLNRYLWRSGGQTGDTADLEGLRLMPLYLSCRAGIRGMVAASRGAGLEAGSHDFTAAKAEARGYIAQALSAFDTPVPRLIAVGGLSGTGKSTLAAALAPEIGGQLGALHLRSDLERKAMAGVEETERLPPEHYTPEASRQVYERILRRASVALAAGQSVIVDAVFATPEERERAAGVANAAGIGFTGLWLSADPGVLRRRVEQRQWDASDATAAVVDRQLGYDLGPLAWTQLDAGGTVELTLEAAQAALGHAGPES